MVKSEIKYAERSDRNRGHLDIISDYYMKANKDKLLKFYNMVTSNPSVSMPKLKSEIRRVNSSYVSFFKIGYFESELANPTKDTFGILYNILNDLVYSEIYNDDAEEDVVSDLQNKLEETLGKDYDAIHHMSNGRYNDDVEFDFMKNYGAILVRNNDHFDMYEFNKNNLVKCLEAICAKNQNKHLGRMPLKHLEFNLMNPATLEQTIYINTFTRPSTSSTKSIKIGDLLGADEKPQTAFNLPKAHLAVDPFSKAGVMQSDLLRKQWAQRTSD